MKFLVRGTFFFLLRANSPNYTLFFSVFNLEKYDLDSNSFNHLKMLKILLVRMRLSVVADVVASAVVGFVVSWGCSSLLLFLYVSCCYYFLVFVVPAVVVVNFTLLYLLWLCCCCCCMSVFFSTDISNTVLVVGVTRVNFVIVVLVVVVVAVSNYNTFSQGKETIRLVKFSELHFSSHLLPLSLSLIIFNNR